MGKLTVYLYCLVESLIYMAVALLVGWFTTLIHPYFPILSIFLVFVFCAIISSINFVIRTDGFAFFKSEEEEDELG